MMPDVPWVPEPAYTTLETNGHTYRLVVTRFPGDKGDDRVWDLVVVHRDGQPVARYLGIA